jgi:tetratricopeptide (TPR) repeat protein
MINLRKNQEKLISVVVTFATFSAVLSGLGCDRSAVVTGPSIDSGDAKMATAKIAEADTLFEGREDLNKARVAVAALRQARLADYGNYDAAWKLARASFHVGDRTQSSAERDDMFSEGTDAGKAAVKLQPDKPEGHFWLGANYGGSAAHSTIANLSSFQDIKREMETVLKLDESYEGYSAYLGLGRLYLQAPKVLGGDTEKAIEYLGKGLKLNPTHGLMRYHLAQAYASANQDEAAKQQLEILIKMPSSDPKYAAEHKDAVEKAKKLLEKIDRR